MSDNKSAVRLVDDGESATALKIDDAVIAGLEVVLEAHLGSATMSVAKLTQLCSGDCVALDAALNQDVELRLNGATIAFGELVTVGSNFGVRITDIPQK